MASGFFTLFEDIASLMDDVAIMSKTSAKQTAGVLGDDLAVNANKASNFPPSREIPVLWAITKGSFINKLILLPFAFLLSAFAPWIIIPILMLGGVYLAYEGAEKIIEWIFHNPKKIEDKNSNLDNIESQESAKIRSAIFTDFILSIEIVIIALGSVNNQPLSVQIPVVTIVSLLATVGVYGIVALIVRLDDMGLALINMGSKYNFLIGIGKFMVYILPKLIKTLSVIGTFAMLLVAGGIFLHNIPQLHSYFHYLPSLLAELIIGIVISLVVLVVVYLFKKIATR